MLVEHLPHLQTLRVILASASPRRRELLQLQGLKFEVVVSGFAEDFSKSSFASAADYARATSAAKAQEVAGRAWDAGATPDLIIAADTVVEHNGVILEKPADEEDAFRVLRSLSGSTHHVHSGVALVLPRGPRRAEAVTRSFACTTEVKFDQLSDAVIWAYVKSGEPMDKAGSYGIQGAAGAFVRGIRGCYFNVVGLPVNRVAREIAGMVNEGLL